MCVVVRAGAPTVVLELLWGSRHVRGGATALISASLYAGPPIIRVVRVRVFVLAWEEAVGELDAMASAVSVCALSAAKSARSMRGNMVVIGVPSVRGLFVRRWGAAVGDICRRCRPLGSVGLLSSLAWKVTHRAAEGGVRLW